MVSGVLVTLPSSPAPVLLPWLLVLEAPSKPSEWWETCLSSPHWSPFPALCHHTVKTG